MKRFFPLAVLAFCLASCSVGMQNDAIYLARETLDAMVFREAEATLFQYPADSLTSALVVGNKLIVFNHKDKNHGYIGSSMLDDLKNWTWAVGRGYNAGQALAPLLSESQGQVVLYDPTLKKLILVDQESSREIHTDVLTQRILPVGDHFLYLNPNSFDGKEARFRWLENTGRKKKVQPQDNHYMNALNGIILYGGERKRAVFGSEYTPELEFYDSSLRFFKKVILPNPPSIFMELGSESGPNMVLVQDRHTSFRSGSGGKDFFATIYHDVNSQADMVLVFNWDGILLDGFHTNLAAKRISLSESGNLVYVWGRSGQQDVLQSFRLECDE